MLAWCCDSVFRICFSVRLKLDPCDPPAGRRSSGILGGDFVCGGYAGGRVDYCRFRVPRWRSASHDSECAVTSEEFCCRVRCNCSRYRSSKSATAGSIALLAYSARMAGKRRGNICSIVRCEPRPRLADSRRVAFVLVPYCTRDCRLGFVDQRLGVQCLCTGPCSPGCDSSSPSGCYAIAFEHP